MSDPKATTDDLLDEGFIASQFGAPADFPAYLAKVITSAHLWVEQKCVAAQYASLPSGSYAEDCARHAEVHYACAELFRRRYAFYESNAAMGQESNKAQVLAELRTKAATALQDATYWLGEALRAAGVDDSTLYAGSGLASGTVETGRYPSLTELTS